MLVPLWTALVPLWTALVPLARAPVPQAGAVAVAVNVTAVQPTATGHLKLYPSGAPLPATSVVSFKAGTIRAGSAVAALGVAGEVEAWPEMPFGSAHLVLDVFGYFR